MAEWVCNNCKYEFDGGFFNNNRCPRCYGWGARLKTLLKRVLKIGIALALVLVGLALIFPSLYEKVADTAGAFLDSRVFYAYGHEAYMTGILKGQSRHYYALSSARPYYKEIVPSERLKEVKPLGSLAKGRVALLGGVIRRGGDVWVPAEFYMGENPVRGFLLFPRKWEESAKSFDWEKAVDGFREKYRKQVKADFTIAAVESAEEKTYREENPDSFKLPDFDDKQTSYYAKKTDKAAIERIHDYYLGSKNLALEILQADPDYVRPKLSAEKTEDK